MSATGNIQGVQWVPGMPDCVVNWSTDLKLYKISVVPREYKPKKSDHQDYIVNCPALKSELKCRINEAPHYTKCVSVCPVGASTPSSPNRSPTSQVPASGASDVKVAVGQANGRISLLSFYAGGAAIKEFGPKTGRQCYDLAWNPKYTNYLAAAYEKNRNENSILIFDTSMNMPSQPEVASNSAASAVAKMVTKSSNYVARDFIRAAVELGLGETCNSLAWFNDKPETLVAGFNLKNLKIFDIRLGSRTHMSSKPLKQNVTRYTFGLCVDPHMDFRVASYYEDTVAIWDTRNFDKPIWTKSQSGEIVHLSWSPTRSGLLCSMVKGSTDTLMLHDIQSWSFMSEDGEPAVTQRAVFVLPLEYPDPAVHVDEDVEIEGKDVITSFAWHPTEENCLVACRKDGRLAEVHVMERIAPSWSSRHFLAWPHNGTLRSFDTNGESFCHTNDISVVMEKRANEGCFKSASPPISYEDENLGYHIKLAFSWLEDCKALMSDLAFKNQFPRQVTSPGIRTALGLDRGKGMTFVLKSDITYKNWNVGHAVEPKGQKPKRIFQGDARHKALRLCGWGIDEAELKVFTERLEKRGEFSRAAALAVFNLEIRLALQILERASDCELLPMVAMALSGFSEEKVGDLWREMVASLVPKLQQPYLRTMFQFLLITTTWNGSDMEAFDAILLEEGIMPSDRVAFACLYLPDERLCDFVNQYWEKAFHDGDIGSIYLSGASSNESVDLLQQYIDLTGDIQTASWISLLYMPNEVLNSNETVQNWMFSYRNLLSTWHLVRERAQFDNSCLSTGAVKVQMQQVYVSCNFCGHPISKNNNGLPEMVIPANAANIQDMKKVAAALNTNGIQKHTARFQSCPSCRKPLPRCTVCLLNMGSHSGYLIGANHHLPSDKNKAGTKVTPFKNFFTWCQLCRHGGHAEHIQDWFDEYSECPVSGCSCKCNSMDIELTSDLLNNPPDDRKVVDEMMENLSLSEAEQQVIK